MRAVLVWIMVAWASGFGFAPASAEDLSGGPFYVYEVYEAETPVVGCKPMPEASLAKTMWVGPQGGVQMLGEASNVSLRENAFMIEDEAAVQAVDGYDGYLVVAHDESLDDALVPGNILAGSFGIRRIVSLAQNNGAIDAFVPFDAATGQALVRTTRHRSIEPSKDGYVLIETEEADFSALLCDAELVIQWDPIESPIETTPLGGDCEGHSPCDVVLPIAQENAFEAPSFDPGGPESVYGAEPRDGDGIFSCTGVLDGISRIKPRIRFETPRLDLTLRVRQGVARLDGSAGISAGLLVSIQGQVFDKLRCEADFLRMVTGKELEITLATIPVFGIPVHIYLKPFVTGFIEFASEAPRVEIDLEAGVEPTFALGWDGGPLAEFDLNRTFDASVQMEPPSSSNPWTANMETGIDAGAELGAKVGGKILGVKATVKLFVKPFGRVSTNLQMSSHQPCVFSLSGELAAKLKFGLKVIFKLFSFGLLDVNIESMPLSLGSSLTWLENEFAMAAFGCPNEPEFEIPIGDGPDTWLCSQSGPIFNGPNAEALCQSARSADPRCASTSSTNPNGETCGPVGSDQITCSPCEATGLGGTWVYSVYDCSCGEPQSCDYPCCTSSSDCNAGEVCNQAGTCEPQCLQSGSMCENDGQCCSGDCACVFACNAPFPVLACS